MKKTLFLAFSLSALSLSAQQQVFDFEDLTISDSTYVNGTAQHPAGQAKSTFTFGDDLVGFTASVSEFSGVAYASGIGYSNQDNLDTAGFTNAGSAYNTNLAKASAVFGIVNGGGSKITFAEPVRLESIDLTNNTYAYLSMKNGDKLAKKFGGVDGTDADTFAVVIKAYDAAEQLIDSINFKLADFTAANSADDYIVDQWTTLSFASLKDSVSSIKFYFTSTDKNSYGILTPAYVAIDNITFSTYPETPVVEEPEVETPATSSSETSVAKNFAIVGGTVSLEGAVSISVYSLSGILLAQGTDAVSAQGACVAVAVAADGTVVSEQIFID